MNHTNDCAGGDPCEPIDPRQRWMQPPSSYVHEAKLMLDDDAPDCRILRLANRLDMQDQGGPSAFDGIYDESESE